MFTVQIEEMNTEMLVVHLLLVVLSPRNYPCCFKMSQVTHVSSMSKHDSNPRKPQKFWGFVQLPNVARHRRSESPGDHVETMCSVARRGSCQALPW